MIVDLIFDANGPAGDCRCEIILPPGSMCWILCLDSRTMPATVPRAELSFLLAWIRVSRSQKESRYSGLPHDVLNGAPQCEAPIRSPPYRTHNDHAVGPALQFLQYGDCGVLP